MNYTEVRKMNMSDLQNLCVRKNWYNNGNSEDYMKLLLSVQGGKNITTNDIMQIAQNIAENSSELSEHIKEDLEYVCFELFEICHTFIDIKI